MFLRVHRAPINILRSDKLTKRENSKNIETVGLFNEYVSKTVRSLVQTMHAGPLIILYLFYLHALVPSLPLSLLT